MKNTEPLAQLPIAQDGNCLFRAFSSILTGSQDSHSKIRAEICRYIVPQGASFLSRYIKTKFVNLTPAEYLQNHQMYHDCVWGTDVEIIALSKMLDVDIYVSNLHFQSKKSQTTWYRYCTNHQKYTTPALYLSNQCLSL